MSECEYNWVITSHIYNISFTYSYVYWPLSVPFQKHPSLATILLFSIHQLFPNFSGTFIGTVCISVYCFVPEGLGESLASFPRGDLAWSQLEQSPEQIQFVVVNVSSHQTLYFLKFGFPFGILPFE